jgi:acyl carrier protein
MRNHNMDDTLQRMQRTFRAVLDNDTLELLPNMTASDVEGWDSLTHIDIIVSLEHEFKIRFTTAEISNLKNVGELEALVAGKRRHS